MSKRDGATLALPTFHPPELNPRRNNAMADRTSESFEAPQFAKDLFATQQNFLQSTKIFSQLTEVARIMTQAQMAYSEAMMQANAAMFNGFFPHTAPQEETRPSVAARHPVHTQANH
jgi:hypothetical protein